MNFDELALFAYRTRSIHAMGKGAMKAKLFLVLSVALLTLVLGTAVASATRPECIHIDEGPVSFDCGRGEPEALGAPPAVYLDGENVTGG